MGNSCLQCVTISCSRILRFSLPGSQYWFVSESCSEETSVKPQDRFHILTVVFLFYDEGECLWLHDPRLQ